MKRKKSIFACLCAVMILTAFMTACSRGGPSADSSTPSVSSVAPESGSSGAESAGQEHLSSSTSSKILVAYFSRVGNTNFSDNVDVETSASLNAGKNGLVGSTEIVAKQIHALVGGDLVEIQTAKPYPADYRTTVQQNVDEAKEKFKPELKTRIENMDSYDTVYLGYPTWAMDIPRPIASFLSEYDLKGKTIIPFNTNGGYGLGSTVDSIKELCPDSTILDAFEMPGANVRDVRGVQKAVSDWLNKIGMVK